MIIFFVNKGMGLHKFILLPAPFRKCKLTWFLCFQMEYIMAFVFIIVVHLFLTVFFVLILHVLNE